MKQTFYSLALASLCVLQSCNQNDQASKNGSNSGRMIPLPAVNAEANNSQAVTIEKANKMIKSYLESINYQNNDTDLHALIFNADSLRQYLNDTSNGKIAHVKFMLAHTPEYINNGGENKNCGYRIGALTLVVVGYNEKNDYIYNSQKMVLDHSMPCPANCPKSGNAADDLLPLKP